MDIDAWTMYGKWDDKHSTSIRQESDNQDEEYRLHVWVAGMMYVHQEDVAEIARNRHVECERCEISYKQFKQGGFIQTCN